MIFNYNSSGWVCGNSPFARSPIWSSILSSPFPLLLSVVSSPNLWAFPPQTSRNDKNWPGTVGCKQGTRILGTAKLCALLNWAPSCLEPLVLRKAVSCALLVGKFWRGEARRAKGKEETRKWLKSNRDSSHYRSDRPLRAQVWHGFGLGFQMKIDGRWPKCIQMHG